MTDDMNRQQFAELLGGKDLRTIRQNAIVVRSVKSQEMFDELFALALHHERPLAMRATDAIEKVTKKHPQYLTPHKAQLLGIMRGADHKELKWHIAQLITRITLNQNELTEVWHLLSYWALNKNESKIVRVNALQGLFDFSVKYPELKNEFEKTLSIMEREMIPSIQARIRKLKSKKRNERDGVPVS
jgi:hypothetical protein